MTPPRSPLRDRGMRIFVGWQPVRLSQTKPVVLWPHVLIPAPTSVSGPLRSVTVAVGKAGPPPTEGWNGEAETLKARIGSG